MVPSLADRIGVHGRELFSIVGAGGKSTILFALGRELAGTASRIILTTTTKMAAAQIAEPTCWSDEPTDVERALVPGRPLFVATGVVPGKVTGPAPDAVNCLFAETTSDHVIVEADGARSMSIKAPADHEPVIPSASTTVVVVAAIDAIGRPVRAVAHRADRVAMIAGIQQDDLLTVEDAASVLLHPEGGMKGIPASARVVMALTKVAPDSVQVANRLAAILGSQLRIDRAIAVGTTEP
jgi:molybdenum cofactor cytidylyltransferase